MRNFLLIIFLLSVTKVYSDSISLYAENDFAWDNDGYYSHGTQLSYKNDKYNWGLKIAQQICTPENKDSDQPQYNDRPYCGWTHLDYYKEIQTDNWIDHYEFGLGVVGPASGAELAQTEIHRLIGNVLPKGWQYQIENEPTFQGAYFKTLSCYLNKYLEYRPQAGINLGNALTDAELAQYLRFGYNIPGYFDPTIETFRATNQKQFFIFGFLGVKGKLVGRNILLDGNTFKDNVVTVDKEYFVADGLIGLCLGFKWFETSIVHTERTKEFETQSRDNRFDSISLTVNF